MVENYDVDFFEPKHGLLRDILTDYQFRDETGNIEKRTIYITNVSVPGQPVEFSSRFDERMDGKLQIRIGDKNKTITGPQHYEIRYRVKNALLFSDSLVQLYWNVKAAGWDAPFNKVAFHVYAPDGVHLSPENCFVYAGATGNDQVSDEFICDYQNHAFSGMSKKDVQIGGGDNVTVLVKLPRRLVAEVNYAPSLFRQYSWTAILAALLLLFWWIWQKWGKDDEVVAATSYYPPPGVDPAMAGYLINDKEDATDLVALLPKWGADGLIRIEEIPKKGWFGKGDTRISKRNDLPGEAAAYEQTIFSGLFPGRNEVLLSSLKDSFYKTMAVAKRELREKAQVYYEATSNRVMLLAYVFFFLLAIVLSIFLFIWYGTLAAVASAVICLFLTVMSFYLRKKNKRGNAVFAELKGFRQFIKLAEVDRIKVLIQDDPHYFEKTMSFALAFGLLARWASKFAALDVPPPSWYHGPSGMNIQHFGQSFSSSMSAAQYNMVSSPSGSSSGGGSSGGGFGGGGGGSW